MTIKMYAPWLKGVIVGSDSKEISVDANGIANIADVDVLPLLKAGFSLSSGGAAMPECRRTTAANNANCVLVANAMAYGKRVILVVSGAAAITATTEDANNIMNVLPNPKLWDTWMVRVININSGNLTLAAGNNVAFNGTAVIATNRYADFMAQIIDVGGEVANRMVYYNVGFGNAT